MTTIHTLKRNIGCIFISTMFAICLLFFVPASVCSQSVDFWVQTPSDWIEKTDRLGKELMKQVVAPDGTAFIEVYGTEGPNPGTRAIADGWESEARQRGADYVQTRLSDMSQQVDNREGILREYEGTYNGIPIRSFIQYAYGNSGAVVVVGVFVQHAAAKYRDLVFQCVTSLRFSPPRSMSGNTSATASASGSPYDDSPYGTATITDICADIAGEWKWFNGGTAVILADGTIQGTGHSWKCLDSSQRTFLISWSNGKWLDTLTLSQDGNRLDGKNQNGNRVWAERKTPTPSSPPSPKISTSMTLRNAILGKWKWFTGSTPEFRADGTIGGNADNRWELTDAGTRLFTLSWGKGKWIDTLTLSPDGKRLDGKNQYGSAVWGKKITQATPPPSPTDSTKAIRNAILGKWKWFTGSTPEFRADGTIGGNADNRWELTDAGTRLFTLSWGKGKWIDTLTLSPDGKRLDGKNQYGSAVWGKRLSPLP